MEGLGESWRWAGGANHRAPTRQRCGGLHPLPWGVPRVAALVRGPARARRARPPLPPTELDHAPGNRRRPAPPSPPQRLHGPVRLGLWAHLPELAGHDVFGPTNAEGLLVLLDKATYVVRLLNPLTHQAADLPPATTLYRLWRRGHERPTNTYPRKDFEVAAAGLADDTTVAVSFRGIQMLAVAKPGDEQWTLVDRGNYLWPAISFISFAGRFYCTTHQAVMVVETTTNQPPRLVVAAELAIQFSGIMSTEHLVDNAGELMLVYRIAGFETIHEGYDSDDYQEDYQERCVVQYKAYRVDLDARKTKPTRGLGGRAVFIGARRAISVSPLVFPSIRNDSVYLGLDRMLGSAGESTTGPHHFVDGTAMSYGEGSCSPERCDSGEDSVPEYGPGSIDEYLSRYVTGSRDNSEDT